jgi:hypothetical protein
MPDTGKIKRHVSLKTGMNISGSNGFCGFMQIQAVIAFNKNIVRSAEMKF